MKKQFLEIGQLTKTHGIKGEMNLQYWCDGFDVLDELKAVYLNKGEKELLIENVRPHKSIAIIKFKGIDTIEQTADYLRKIIYVNRNDLKLDEGTYFHQDLIGLDVKDVDTGVVYGKISNIYQTGSNDVYEIDGEKKLLFPAIADVIKTVDFDSNQIIIKPLDGLFD